MQEHGVWSSMCDSSLKQETTTHSRNHVHITNNINIFESKFIFIIDVISDFIQYKSIQMFWSVRLF